MERELSIQSQFIPALRIQIIGDLMRLKSQPLAKIKQILEFRQSQGASRFYAGFHLDDGGESFYTTTWMTVLLCIKFQRRQSVIFFVCFMGKPEIRSSW